MEVQKPRVSMPVKRKLTTILASDVESYTRLMRDNEEATLNTLSEYREIIDGLIERHDGKIFSTAGDSVLAEFDSTVEAVRCAISFQEEIKTRNTELPEDRRLRFRIGINVGDVMAKGGTLYGDGINVAARLEGLAESGGICVSGAAFEQIKHKLSMGFEDMGAQDVKNIEDPISVFRLVAAPVAVSKSGDQTQDNKKIKADKKRNEKEARAADREARKQVRLERNQEKEEDRWERRNRRQRRGMPFKKTMVLGAAAALAITLVDPTYMPSVREACSHMNFVSGKILQNNAPSSIAGRAKLQESWSWRLQKLWSKAEKEICW